jgi:phage host-nuclease inhibitor protein Gam
MARKKPKNLYPVKDLAAANTAMALIAELKRKITAIGDSMNEDIDRIKLEAKALAAPLHTRLAEIENGLLAYAEYNKDDLFKSKRSVDIECGSLGYRRSKEVKPKPKMTWASVLETIKQMGFKKAIRTKESVNKEELHDWPDDRLDVIGARRVKKDTFWYEINEQKLSEEAA